MNAAEKHRSKFREVFREVVPNLPDDNDQLNDIYELYGELLTRIEERGFDIRVREPYPREGVYGSRFRTYSAVVRPPQSLVIAYLEITLTIVDTSRSIGDRNYLREIGRWLESGEELVGHHRWIELGNFIFVDFSIFAGGCHSGESLEATLVRDGPDQCLSRAIAILSGRDEVWGTFGDSPLQGSNKHYLRRNRERW